ncbi:ESX secretion-associated protein EspG [Herbihabitans rhizosphaerae]|uniref:ESX secretion-associated protein EspG n=1 Tax=Herbihabitans rhizosphaerae TaxID=1872711 RepID=UPI001A9167A6|nr:ESX secretion-associated protein EspG [Herbihabitans rhizosphaerae]
MLQADEFNVLWRLAGLDEKPLPLDPPEQGVTRSEVAAARERATEALLDRGLLLGTTVADDIAKALRLLARPEVAVDLRWAGDGLDIGALAVRRGERAVGGVYDGDTVTLYTLRPSGHITELVAVLGDHPRGEGSSVSLPTDLLDQARHTQTGSGRAFENSLRRNRVSSEDAGQLRTVVEAPRHRGGQVGVTINDRLGRSARGPWTITVLDTDLGRYTIHQRAGYTTVAPADTSRIITMVHELLDNTRPLGPGS